MRYFTDSILLLLYSTLTFFYVPADQALVFALLFAVILCCITYLLLNLIECRRYPHPQLLYDPMTDNRSKLSAAEVSELSLSV